MTLSPLSSDLVDYDNAIAAKDKRLSAKRRLLREDDLFGVGHLSFLVRSPLRIGLRIQSATGFPVAADL